LGRYRWILQVGDVGVAAATGAVMLLSRPGSIAAQSSYAVVAVLLPLLWLTALCMTASYRATLFGNGSEEYRRVGRAGLWLLAGVSMVSYGGKLEIARSVVVFAVPALTVATLAWRLAARRGLQRARRSDRCLKRVVAVGRSVAVAGLVRRLHHDRYAGMKVVATCVPDPAAAEVLRGTGVEVRGGLDEVVDVVRRHGADAVAVTSASETADVYLRGLSWQLEGTGVELFVSPGLIEVAGPRLHIRPFVGLPLLSVEEPAFAGWKRLVKGTLDRVMAAVALVVLAPVLVVVAGLVKLSGPGPVLYRQVRIGCRGRRYTMLKFRTMVQGADARLAELRESNETDGLLFKIRQDPRVTRVGRWLRRYSIDELPQLVNVVTGTMSLVGPRPPLPEEVERYDSSVRRRLLVKPGLTGLWQISGRSDLSWEESVRLDLRYVENWSLALDLLILGKTFAAVVGTRGAY
jgi:exopolysaccharide biosynthesis polyprenyl glycosylphosphotransferase